MEIISFFVGCALTVAAIVFGPESVIERLQAWRDRR